MIHCLHFGAALALRFTLNVVVLFLCSLLKMSNTNVIINLGIRNVEAYIKGYMYSSSRARIVR